MANYEERSLEELQDIARERDLKGRSGLNKKDLAEALQKDDEEKGVADNAADNVKDGKNEEGGRGVAQESGQDVASRLHDSGPSEEAVKEYQESYAPKKQKEYQKAQEKGEEVSTVGYQSESSDPENPVVEEALEDKEAYQDLSDHDKELADLALDASGPLNLQSPYERIMTGAVDEEQAKEQEEVRSKLPKEFVGNLTEQVSDEDAERIRKAFAGELEEQDEEQEPTLEEQYKARKERYGKLLKRTNENRGSSEDLEEKTIRETQGEEQERVGRGRVWAQRSQLDTSGLGGPASDRIDRAYRTAEVATGQSQATFHAEDPKLSLLKDTNAEDSDKDSDDKE